MIEKLERTRRALNVVLVLACLGSGAGAAVWLVGNAPKPPKRESAIRALSVATVEITPRRESSAIVAYGTVRPKQQVRIIPQVSGALIYAHDDIAQGKFIAEGELLFRINPIPYAAKVAQANAEIRRLEGMLARHTEELQGLDQRLVAVDRMVAIEQQNYLATKQLFDESGVGTIQQVAADERRYLAQQDAAFVLSSRRAMIPHLREETEALLEAARSRLTQAEFELDGTNITCPFDARVESVSAHTSQVVMPPLQIAILTSLEAFEISVGVDPRELRWLEESARPEALDTADGSAAAKVVVRSTVAGRRFEWTGYVTRFERVDEATRTARLVVEVRNADLTARRIDGVDGGGATTGGGTLAIGMYCRTELPARVLEDALLVPRHAIHDNRWVYVFEASADSDDPALGVLGRRSVPRLRTVASGVLVDYRGRGDGPVCELKPYDRVITSRLRRPVVGMPVRLRGAQSMHASLRTAAPPVETSPVLPPMRPTRLPVVLGQATGVSGIR